jgi:hypothetical protein
MEDESNPYEPNSSHVVFNEPPKKLSGFFRGVRNGFFWSLPVFVTLTIFIATYGRKPPPINAAMLQAFQIPAIWMLVAGLVAAVTDRSKR